MINDQNQKQTAGNESTNLQANSIVIHQGISYSDAKEIALDVYKANFTKLAQDAAQSARERAEELTEKFLGRLKRENPAAVQSMTEPAMQMALYEAQKQYAKTGDTDLEELLVDILVERAGILERNIQQIVLDEALSIASKLTNEHMDALTINFLISRTINNNIGDLSAMGNYITTYFNPFIDNFNGTTSCYEHLEYLGCGSILYIGDFQSIEHLYSQRYGGLFSKGFSEKILQQEIENFNQYSSLIINCLHDSSLLQLSVMNLSVLDEICRTQKIPENIKLKLSELFNSSIMPPAEIKGYIIKILPTAQKLFDLWDNSGLSRFSLTTVGIAIAQANFRRKTGIKLNLSIWVK